MGARAGCAPQEEPTAMRTTIVMSFTVLSVLAIASGCGKKDPGAAAAGSAAPAAAGPHKPGPAAMVADRRAEAKFEKYDGAGKKRRAMFNVTNHGGKDAKFMQSWIYYYDKAGKVLDSYPHAFGLEALKDGASKEMALGQEGDKIHAGTHTTEGEITRIEFVD